jgi:hypothetical protein
MDSRVESRRRTAGGRRQRRRGAADMGFGPPQAALAVETVQESAGRGSVD